MRKKPYNPKYHFVDVPVRERKKTATTLKSEAELTASQMMKARIAIQKRTRFLSPNTGGTADFKIKKMKRELRRMQHEENAGRVAA